MSNFPTILGVTIPHYGGIGVVNQRRKYYPPKAIFAPPLPSCCLYPSPFLNAGIYPQTALYPTSDLPLNLVFHDVAFVDYPITLEGHTYWSSVIGVSGFYAVTPFNNFFIPPPRVETSWFSWNYDHSTPGMHQFETDVTDWGASGLWQGDCISGTGSYPFVPGGPPSVTDNFSSSYIVSYGSKVITRVNDCTWQSQPQNTPITGVFIRLSYTLNAVSYLGHMKPAWRLTIYNRASLTYDHYKTDPQNSPAGNYPSGLTVS